MFTILLTFYPRAKRERCLSLSLSVYSSLCLNPSFMCYSSSHIDLHICFSVLCYDFVTFVDGTPFLVFR